MDMTLLHEMGPKDEHHLLSGIPILGNPGIFFGWDSRIPGSNILFVIDFTSQEPSCLKNIPNNAIEAVLIEYVACIGVICLEVVGPNL